MWLRRVKPKPAHLRVATLAILIVMCTLLILSAVFPFPEATISSLLSIGLGTSKYAAAQPVSTNGMAYAQVNKSGCHVHNGNCQIRLDFYLEPEDVRYYDRYLYLVDETSPEYLAGYPGEVDKDGNPVDQAEYDKWWEGLPRVWVNTPFHSHFVYLPADFTEDDIKAQIDIHLGNFYQAFQDGWDAVQGGMRHGWDTKTRTRPTDYSKVETSVEYDARVAACEATLSSLTEFQHKPEGETQGEIFPATEIDIGSAALPRAAYQDSDRYTLVDAVNPANDTGVIDYCEIYANVANSDDTWVGTFSASGNVLTCRDSVSLGDITAGSKQTFSSLDIDVVSGDYFGMHDKTGSSRIEADIVVSSVWRYEGECIDASDSQTFSLETYQISLYGTGETAGEPSISNTPGSKAFGILAVNTTSNTSIDYFTITNNGTGAVDVTIQGTDLTAEQSFHPITPVDVTPGSSATWVDVDVSAYVPSGTTGVILHLTNEYTSTIETGLRKNGSTDDRHDIGSLRSSTHTWAMIGVDSSRIFEAYLEVLTNVHLYLVGYTTQGVTFLTNGVNKTPSTVGSWQDVDCSMEAPNAVGLIFEIGTLTAEPQSFGMRKNGSTDSRTNMNEGHATFTVVIGCDTSQIAECLVAHANLRVYLIGYITSGAVFNTNATDLSLGATGAWTDLAAIPASSVMGFIEVKTSTIADYGLRVNGSSEELYMDAFYHPWAFIECDENYIIEGKISSTNVDFFLVGYAITPGVTWDLSDTATPGENTYGLYAGLDDEDDTFDVIIRETATYNTLVSNLAENATQDWGIKIYMPTSVSGYGNQQMSATITLVASAAS